MALLSDLLNALADNVRNALDIDWDVQVEPWLIINPTPITIDMFPADPPQDDQMAGFGDLEGARFFTVRARTNTPDSGATREILLALMDIEDDHSVHVALIDDQTLGGLASEVVVTGGTGLSAFPTPDGIAAYLGVQWTVEVVDVRT